MAARYWNLAAARSVTATKDRLINVRPKLLGYVEEAVDSELD
jgi:hypothetical protein